MSTKHLAFNLAQSRQLTTRRFLPLLADERIQCQQEMLLESRCCPSPLTVSLGLREPGIKIVQEPCPHTYCFLACWKALLFPPEVLHSDPSVVLYLFSVCCSSVRNNLSSFFLMNPVSSFFFFCHLKSIISINNHPFIPEFLTPLSE